MNFQITIDNLLIVASSDTSRLADSLQSLQALLTAECGEVKAVSPNALRFKADWEPPLKSLKKWSSENPEVQLVLWADAFAKHHWLLKATFQGGKGEDLTVSRIDDEFEAFFQEIYGCTFAEWEKKPTPPFTQTPEIKPSATSRSAI